ncbi:MAG: GIY-YIG nuclease family protein [Desulfobacteraceae bacterium]|nr:GIY-YIG nuclease family protein [Desulfobacteraceae bacterium]
MYYTYILRSKKEKKQFVGLTKDIDTRFKQHNDGEVKSTKEFSPFTLLYYEACHKKDDAKIREKFFKTPKGRLFLKKRLKSYFEGS